MVELASVCDTGGSLSVLADPEVRPCVSLTLITDAIDFLAYLFGLGFLIIRKTNYLEITPFLERKSISMFIRKPSASLLVPNLALVNLYSVRFPSDFFFFGEYLITK